MKDNPTAPEPPIANSAIAGSRRFDAIIIIYGAAVRADGTPSPTLLHRVEAAARLAARFDQPLFIPTGAKGRHGKAEALVMADLLNQAGFPSSSMLIEATGTDTLSSTRAVRRLLAPITPLGPIYAATSGYHLPRCLLLLRLAGVMAAACPPPAIPASSRFWLRWFWRLREMLALPYDALLMLWLRACGRV